MPPVRATTQLHRKTRRIQVEPSRPGRAWEVPQLANSYVLDGLLGLIAFLAATAIGMRYMFDFRNGQPPLTSTVDLLPFAWAWHHLHHVADGLPFSLTLLAILIAHRLGHSWACRFFQVDNAHAAVVALLQPGRNSGSVCCTGLRVHSRAALITIGAAGPIAGFTIAVLTTCYGLLHSVSMGANSDPSLLRISAPGLIGILRSTMLASYPDIPPLLHLLPHPVLVASWCGLLVTAWTLIPAGRLDGGQILYAISPRLHAIASTCTIGALLYLGTVEWLGWLLLVLVLILPSMKHPKIVGRTALSIEWLVVAPVCLAIFSLTISTQPITGMSLTHVLLRIRWGV